TDDEIVVDADLAEFVDDDGVLLPVRLRQDTVEQRGLAGAEIAGEHGDGDLVGHRATPFGPRIYASVGGCHRARAGWVRRVGKGAEPLFPRKCICVRAFAHAIALAGKIRLCCAMTAWATAKRRCPRYDCCRLISSPAATP